MFVDEDIYQGRYYATVTDYACGDLRDAYGQALINAGYTKVNNEKYTKSVLNSEVGYTVSADVLLKYSAPTKMYPNGVLTLYFRENTNTVTFASIKIYKFC